MRVKLDEYKELLKKAEIVTFLMLNLNMFQLQDIVVAYNAYLCHQREEDRINNSSKSWFSFDYNREEKKKNEYDELANKIILVFVTKLMAGFVLGFESHEKHRNHDAFCCAKLMCILQYHFIDPDSIYAEIIKSLLKQAADSTRVKYDDKWKKLITEYKSTTLPRFKLQKSAKYIDHEINPELREKFNKIDKKDFNLYSNTFDNEHVSYLIKVLMQQF